MTDTTSVLKKLNLGCGPIQPEGWENVDGSLRAWVVSHLRLLDRMMVHLRCLPPTDFKSGIRFANLLRPLPWAADSIDCIYLGEVLEHFSREPGLRLLSECFRVLRRGGTIRCRVPDNARFWRNYLKEFDEAYQCPREQWTEPHSRWVEMFFKEICVRRRTIGSFGHYHKWMYDEISLILTLERVGFVAAMRRTFLDSAIPDVATVETRDDLIVEATKP